MGTEHQQSEKVRSQLRALTTRMERVERHLGITAGGQPAPAAAALRTAPRAPMASSARGVQVSVRRVAPQEPPRVQPAGPPSSDALATFAEGVKGLTQLAADISKMFQPQPAAAEAPPAATDEPAAHTMAADPASELDWLEAEDGKKPPPVVDPNNPVG